MHYTTVNCLPCQLSCALRRITALKLGQCFRGFHVSTFVEKCRTVTEGLRCVKKSDLKMVQLKLGDDKRGSNATRNGEIHLINAPAADVPMLANVKRVCVTDRKETLQSPTGRQR
jgi:hypothetical protein